MIIIYYWAYYNCYVIIIINIIIGNCQVCSTAVGIESSHDYVHKQLLNIKEKCARQKIPEPTDITVDDCCQFAPGVRKIFPNIRVCQDIKHVINRCIDCLSKNHALYSIFSQQFHGAFKNPDIPVKGRDGKFYSVPNKLPPGTEILSRLEKLIEEYKEVAASLFLKDFEHTFNNQKYHIVNCIHDVLDADGKWYTQTTVR